LLVDLDVDLVHTAVYEADVVGRIAGATSGRSVTSSLVNTSYDPVRLDDPHVGRVRLAAARMLDRTTARACVSAFHAVTHGVAGANLAALHLRPDRVRVVERGRELALFAPATDPRCRADERRSVRTSLGVDGDVALVITVGRQEFQKDHPTFVESIALLSSMGRRVEGLIVGRNGNATDVLADEIKRRDANVRVIGHVADIAGVLRAADVFVLSSRYEGTAGAVLEAFASCLPVVSTNVAGLRGVVRHGENALVVRAGSAAAIAAAVGSLLDDTQRRDRLVGTAFAEARARYDIERSAREMAAFFRWAAALQAPALTRFKGMSKRPSPRE